MSLSHQILQDHLVRSSIRARLIYNNTQNKVSKLTIKPTYDAIKNNNASEFLQVTIVLYHIYVFTVLQKCNNSEMTLTSVPLSKTKNHKALCQQLPPVIAAHQCFHF